VEYEDIEGEGVKGEDVEGEDVESEDVEGEGKDVEGEDETCPTKIAVGATTPSGGPSDRQRVVANNSMDGRITAPPALLTGTQGVSSSRVLNPALVRT
jgi:hypothetical protein